MTNAVRFIIEALVLYIAVLAITYTLFSLLPDSAARSALGVNANQQAVLQFNEEHGLNKHPLDRILRYVVGGLTFNLGNSYRSNEAVLPIVSKAFLVTFFHCIAAIFFAAGVSCILAYFVWFRLKAREVMRFLSITITSIPSVVVALVVGLALVGFNLNWNSINFGMILALSVVPIAVFSLSSTDTINSASSTTRINTAEAWGIDKHRQFFWYLVPELVAAWLPQLSTIAASIFVTAIVFELTFSLAGLGLQFYNAISFKDLPMLRGFCTMLLAGFLLFDISIRILLAKVR